MNKLDFINQLKRIRLSIFIPLLVMLVVPAGAAVAQQAFFMGLGDLHGGEFFSFATDVSDDGSAVVGWSLKGSGDASVADAFRWTRQSGIVSLGADGAFNDIKVSADGSTVVGNAGGSSEPATYAFRWSETTGAVQLPAGVLVARGVSGDGSVIVGQAPQPSLGTNQAIKWTDSGGVEQLFTDLPSTAAWDISADGSVILGNTVSSIQSGFFKWNNAEGYTHIAGSDQSIVASVSDNGNVVVGGSNTDATGAWRWTKQSGLVPIGPLTDGKRTLIARGASENGDVIVGSIESDPGSAVSIPGTSIALVSKPFVWDATNGPRNLFDVLANDYGLGSSLAGWKSVASPRGVSGDGRTIVGLGVNPQGKGEAWIAFLGTPVPEPNNLLLAAIGLPVLNFRRRRRCARNSLIR